MIQDNNFTYIMLLYFPLYAWWKCARKNSVIFSLKLCFYFYITYLDRCTIDYPVVQINLEDIIKSSIFPSFYIQLVMNNIFSLNFLKSLCRIYCCCYCLSSIYNLSQMGLPQKQREIGIIFKRHIRECSWECDMSERRDGSNGKWVTSAFNS